LPVRLLVKTMRPVRPVAADDVTVATPATVVATSATTTSRER
jgi:hypothetical protein